MPLIAKLTGRSILDSRGVPTVEVTVELDNGITATSSAPSGAISNSLEALELRDQNAQEYFGQGVMRAVENVNTVMQEALVGMDPLYQTQIDQTLVNLDGTANKSRLGANAILATSQAVMKAAAQSLKLPLFVYIKEKYQLVSSYRVPTPIFNLLNGGAHGSGTLDFQEFQLVPASHLPYSQALRIGVEMFMALDRVLAQKGAIRTVGVEGGFSPNLATNSDALEIFSEAIRLTSYTLAKDAFLGIDAAPKNFYKNNKYTIKDRPQPLPGKAMVKFFQDLHHQFRVFAFEDPLVADAWEDWKFMTAEMGETAMIVADDLVTSNKTLLMKAIQEKACNAVVIKPNRVGTVTEAIEVTNIARQAGWHTIMSHRSGETTDDFLADLAVGIGTEYVKFGAPSRGERVVKYNRLLRIEEILLKSKKTNTPGESPMNFPATTPDPTADASALPANPSVPATPSAAPSSPAPEAAVPSLPLTPATPTPSASTEPAALPSTPPAAAPPAPTDVLPNASSGLSSDQLTATPIPTLAPEPAPTPDTSSVPAAPVAPPAPPMPSGISAIQGEAGSPPATLSPAPVVTPSSATPPADVNTLQSDLNQLAQMAGTTPAAPSTPSPAPLSGTVPTENAAPPAGLTPPTPPAGLS